MNISNYGQILIHIILSTNTSSTNLNMFLNKSSLRQIISYDTILKKLNSFT